MPKNLLCPGISRNPKQNAYATLEEDDFSFSGVAHAFVFAQYRQLLKVGTAAGQHFVHRNFAHDVVNLTTAQVIVLRDGGDCIFRKFVSFRDISKNYLSFLSTMILYCNSALGRQVQESFRKFRHHPERCVRYKLFQIVLQEM